jgi:hypothetical protein
VAAAFGLEQALRGRGKDVWVDTDDIAPATKWREEIHLGLRASDGVNFVMSPDSLRSAECAEELAQAVELHKPDRAGAAPGARGRRPGCARRLQLVYLRAEDDFDTGVEKLIDALDTDIEWVRTHTRLGVRVVLTGTTFHASLRGRPANG